VTAFICHVGYEVTADVLRRLADGVDPDLITQAEAAAGSVPGVVHAQARARWTGRTLRVEVEGWVDPELPARDADALGRLVAGQISRQLSEAGSFAWITRAASPERETNDPFRPNRTVSRGGPRLAASLSG
jgi:divalent metal cation (Fe/Co/Zn/Cd) transporter